MSKNESRLGVLSWAFYDWANSAFSCTVMAGFFPVFFKEYWSAGVDPATSTFHLGTANSTESLIVAAMAPILGAMADRGGAKKKLLSFFALLGIASTALLCSVSRGSWSTAWTLYVVASIGFAGSLIFYDALLVTVARDERTDFVSALGYSLGYLGGGALFALNVAMTLWPASFGFSGAESAVRFSFLTVALWWALFSVPLFVFVKEPKAASKVKWLAAARGGLHQLEATFREIRKLRMVFWFLLAYWLYIDGVDTVMRMAVDYGMNLGFNSQDLVVALLITQFVGFPAALVFGKLGSMIGAKRGILIGVGVYLGISVWGFFMRSAFEFYLIAVIVGLVQGGVQALSRSFYARIIPHDKAAQFYGFYNMLGKFAAVIGPFLMGWAGSITGSPRISILSIGILFIAGAVILWRVDEKEGSASARELESET